MIAEIILYNDGCILEKCAKVACSCETVEHFSSALKFCKLAYNKVVSKDAKQLIKNLEAWIALTSHRIFK